GSGWAIVFVTAGDVHYVLVDSSGAVLAGPVRVSFTPARSTLGLAAAWSGDALGVAWTSFGNPDPPGSIVQFTVLGADGIKQFSEQTVSEGRFGTSVQALNWTGDRFRLDYFPGETGTLREVDFSSSGATLGSPRLISSRGANGTFVVWNGATSGVLFSTLGEMHFETTACLADPTAPPSPSWDDTTAQLDHAYLYRVRAATPQQTTAASNTDLATTTPFTDDPLMANTTQAKWAHMAELRRAVDAVRALAQLPAATYTSPG